MNTRQAKAKKIALFLLKLLFVIIAYWFAADKIANSPDINNLQDYFSDLTRNDFALLILIFILMFANWSLETIKWKFIISTIEKLSFGKALMVVWSGVTVGTVTPNRIGEFAGRIMFLKPENRRKAASLTLFADLSQFITTIMFGLAGITFLAFTTTVDKSLKIPATYTIYISLFVLFLTLYTYYKINGIVLLLQKIKFLKNTVQKFVPNEPISRKSKTIVLVLSIFRYLIFSFQFYLALKIFGIDINLINCFAATSTMFLAVHILPNIAIAEPGVRLSFSVIFIGLFTSDIAAVGIASLLIYFINVFIPILVGGVNILRFRRKREEISNLAT